MELLRILLQHPQAEVVSLHASQDMEAPVSELYPHLKGICDLKIEAFDSQEMNATSRYCFLCNVKWSG